MSTARLVLHISNTRFFSDSRLDSAQAWVRQNVLEHHTGLCGLAILAPIILFLMHVLLHLSTYNDGLPIVNRRFAFEPRVFARIRWATKSRDILKTANEKVSWVVPSWICADDK